MADREDDHDGGDDQPVVEEELTVENNPSLPEVEVKTHEEDEDVVFKMYVV